MKTNSITKLLLASIVGLGFSLSASALPMTKFTKACKPLIDKTQEIPKPPLRGMPERAHKRLTRALEALANDQYDDGIAQLVTLEEKTKEPYVKSVINMNLASAYAQSGKYKEALPHFQNALKYGEGNLPHDRLQDLRQNVASLMYGIGNKKEALNLMNEWMRRSVKDAANAYALLAVIHAEAGNYREAMCPAFYAVKTEKKPKSQYYQLMLVAHYELKDLQGSADVLKEMVQFFPKEVSYWRQLSTLYLQLDRTAESLAIMEMLYLKGGFENEGDYKTLSALFSYEEIPYRSAAILEEGVSKGMVKDEEKNWKSIAANYRVSHELEKAIVAYGKTADLADDGEDYLTQAELYTDLEEWRKVITSVDKALKKGVKDEGKVYFTRGSAQASLGRCKQSLQSLETATKYKKWRKRANAWIAYVKDREKHDKC